MSTEKTVSMAAILASSISKGLADCHDQDLKPSFTIFRVPAHVRQSSGDLYNPKIVSIGPYHSGADHLRPMDHHKWRSLRSLLSRRSSAAIGGDCCVSVALEMEPRARACYWDACRRGADWAPIDLAKMLLLDSCFIIQFLLNNDTTTTIDKDNDPIWRVSWIRALVRSDLLLLENQIPFFVLQTFYNLLVSDEYDKAAGLPRSFLDFATKSFSLEYPPPSPTTQIHHLLHLYHSCSIRIPRNNHQTNSNIFEFSDLCLGQQRRCRAWKTWCSPKSIPCATKLKEAGISFKRKRRKIINCSRLDLEITFQHGVVEIPRLYINDTTRSLLANLVAFEQCLSCCTNKENNNKALTSYALFMNSLISDPTDIAILRRCGIIENMLANDGEAAKFFNELCDCVYEDYEDRQLGMLFGEIMTYCKRRWPRWRARLHQEQEGLPALLVLVLVDLLGGAEEEVPRFLNG